LKGSHVGGIPPFGFKSVRDGDKYRLVADENNAPIIRYVFDEYAKGTPKKAIMEALSKKGVLNYNGKPLTLSCLQHALHNPKYIGKYYFGGEEVEGACEALIDEDTFNKVQETLQGRTHGRNAKKVRQEYLLRDKAFCGHCGARLVGEAGTSRHGQIHNYYSCGKRKKISYLR